MKYNRIRIIAFLIIMAFTFAWPQYRSYQVNMEAAAAQIELQEQAANEISFQQQRDEKQARIKEAIVSDGMYVSLIVRTNRTETSLYDNIEFYGGDILPGENHTFEAWDGYYATICNEEPEKGDLAVLDGWEIEDAVAFITQNNPCIIINGDDFDTRLRIFRPKKTENVEYPSRSNILSQGVRYSGDLVVYFMPNDPSQPPHREVISRINAGNSIGIDVSSSEFLVLGVSSTVQSPSFKIGFLKDGNPQEIAMTRGEMLFPDPNSAVTIYRLR